MPEFKEKCSNNFEEEKNVNAKGTGERRRVRSNYDKFSQAINFRVYKLADLLQDLQALVVRVNAVAFLMLK